MNKRSGTLRVAADKLVRGIKRKTRKQYSAEEKIRIVLAGLRGEESIAALCRDEIHDAESRTHSVTPFVTLGPMSSWPMQEYILIYLKSFCFMAPAVGIEPTTN